MTQDRHKTKKIANIIGIIVSALIAAIGVAGFQRTNDFLQLVVFLVGAALAYLIVIVIFKGVDRLLDSIDDGSSGR